MNVYEYHERLIIIMMLSLNFKVLVINDMIWLRFLRFQYFEKELFFIMLENRLHLKNLQKKLALLLLIMQDLYLKIT